MPVVRDRALVLQRHPWSETSLVVHLLTAGHGRVHALARGAYRVGSRYFGVLDLFDTLELEWSASPARELCDLRAGDVARRRHVLAGDLPRFRAATTVLELADLAARFGPPDSALYARVEAALDALAAGARPAEDELVAFELAYLGHLGLAPALAACAQCGGPAPASAGRASFSAGAGGRLCARCAAEGRARGLRVGTIPVRVLDDARALAAAPSADPAAARTVLSAERIVRVRDLVERFLDYHLETRPRSHRAFLSVPNRNAPPGPSPARSAS